MDLSWERRHSGERRSQRQSKNVPGNGWPAAAIHCPAVIRVFHTTMVAPEVGVPASSTTHGTSVMSVSFSLTAPSVQPYTVLARRAGLEESGTPDRYMLRYISGD
jgi:hypothetical protein